MVNLKYSILKIKISTATTNAAFFPLLFIETGHTNVSPPTQPTSQASRVTPHSHTTLALTHPFSQLESAWVDHPKFTYSPNSLPPSHPRQFGLFPPEPTGSHKFSSLSLSLFFLTLHILIHRTPLIRFSHCRSHIHLLLTQPQQTILLDFSTF